MTTLLIIAAVVLLLLLALYFPLAYFLSGAHQITDEHQEDVALSARQARLDAGARIGSDRPRVRGVPEKVVGLAARPRATAAKGCKR